MPVAVRRPFSVGLVALCSLVGALAFASAPALAAAPEPPAGLEAEPIAARTATLHGVLNPNHAGEKGSYEFVYKQSESECTGEDEKTVPTPAGAATGAKSEAVMAPIAELLPNLPYTFCLRAKNEAGEEALSAPVTFTTLAAAPTIAGESASLVEATEATLEAEVVPEGAATTAHFEYLTEAQFQANGKTFAGAETTAASKSIGADDTTQKVPGVRIPEAGHPALLPNTAYHYRVVATNEVGGKVETVGGSGKTFTTPPAPDTEISQNCPNEQLRAEQPFGLTLPDCRAYEMVSPVETNGQDATDQLARSGVRASLSGEAITYASNGSFGEPAGATIENQYLSHRESDGWSTKAITPLHDPVKTETQGAYRGMAFTPELTAAVVNTNAPLVKGAPGGEADEFGLYADTFAAGAYQYVGPAGSEEGAFPLGVSTDLSHIVFGANSEVSEWVNGSTVLVGRTNENEAMASSVGSAAPNGSFVQFKEVWHAVSSDGSRVYLTSPAFVEQGLGQLYVRVNAEQPQSPLAAPEALGTGTLTAGSSTVTSLLAASGATPVGFQEGVTEVVVNVDVGRFVAGQPVSGPGIEAGTTITNVSGGTITLSAPTTESVQAGSPVSSDGPLPFVIGHTIAGSGIAPGTTITGISAGSLTLSAPATLSGSDLALRGGGVCTESAQACTVEVSASQRTGGAGAQGADLNGSGSARYWGASADGSKVFFTSDQELTNDANTGASDRQVIAVHAGAGGGTYTLTFKGQTTGSLPYDATVEEVQKALGTLSSIGVGNVAVSEAEGADLVTFEDALAGVEQPAVTADSSSLTDGGIVDVKVLPPPGNDLYEYDLESGKLTDLSADAPAADGAAVLGVVQISEDGSYVYFVAEGDLTTGAEAGKPNLYVSHDGGAPTVIATLGPNDSSDWDNGEYNEAGPEVNTAVVSPGGTHLAFLSEASPTHYDNERARQGECASGGETGRCREVFLYDAGSDSHSSTLVCASCGPSGARPVGPSSFGHIQDSYMQYRGRNLLEDGTLFFDSSDALVPHAGDGRQNVYEYEDGHLNAISNVAGGDESNFLDASSSGNDVFFATADQLLPEDTSSSVVVYDARVGGGFPMAAAPPPCDDEDSCKPPPSPQPGVFAPTGSATFSGPGNSTPTVTATVTPRQKTAAQLKAEKLAKALKQCAKDRKKAKRKTCEVAARKKDGAAKPKKAKKSAHGKGSN
jgi:WD40-like Beta Propeller Repeat